MKQLTLEDKLFESEKMEKLAYRKLLRLRRDVEHLASKVSSRAGEINDPKDKDFYHLSSAADGLLNVAYFLGILCYRVTRKLPEHRSRRMESYITDKSKINPYYYEYYSKEELLNSFSRFNRSLLREVRIVSGMITPEDRLSALMDEEISHYMEATHQHLKQISD